MTYDRASWHYDGDYPKDLPRENGGNHIGMFLAWAIINGLESEEHKSDNPDSVRAVRNRQMTGREFLFKECDERFTDLDLNDEGNAFAKHYYLNRKVYLMDYARTFSEAPSLYHVEDTWENYGRLSSVIDLRFQDWKQQTNK